MNTTQVSQSTAAVSLDEAKHHLRVTHTDDDIYIATLIDVATAWAIEDTDCELLDATYLTTFEGPCGQLPKRPVKAIDEVEYQNEDDEWIDVEEEDYEVDWRSAGYTVVSIEDNYPIRVSYTVGLTKALHKQVAKQLVLYLVSQMYAFRELEVTGTIVAKISGYQNLVNILRGVVI